MFQYISENLPEGSTLGNVDEYTFEETFRNLMELTCNDSVMSAQHEEMMNNYIDMLAKSLHSFNDEIGDWEDYKYLAWLGVWSKDSNCAKATLSESEFNGYKNDYQNNVIISSLIGC